MRCQLAQKRSDRLGGCQAETLARRRGKPCDNLLDGQIVLPLLLQQSQDELFDVDEPVCIHLGSFSLIRCRRVARHPTLGMHLAYVAEHTAELPLEIS
jgi:hypothetical protein